ncbi:hypothetical protein BASA81_001554 [Batrachochytrium salamandrivorans]|nr:hypothetical protein BASA81_001554 [Batrachochytrium salamandrivorans]
MATHFDVVICGSGPAGSTTAYFIKTQLPHLQVCMLDKAKFPRDKYCGDAFCAPALDILEEMGVLQDLERRGLVNNTLRGGFVSPSGYSFIANDSGEADGGEKNMATRAYAIKRMICDEAMALKAKSIGCELLEECLVEHAELDQKRGVWTVRMANGKVVTCEILIAADGAASNISRKLGIVTTPTDGVAARQYIKGGTHNFKADGVLLYPEYTLPGYMALFRHYDGSIDLGAYLLPGGVAGEEDIADIYANKIRTDPFISRALGPKWEPLERVKVASLRLGGVAQSYAERFFVVGDAAGHIDPLTGEGIHLGMIAAKLLAGIVKEMFQTQRFHVEFGVKYHQLWMDDFGKDFPLSTMAGKVVYRVPFLMDAVPIAATGKGSGKAATEFFGDFGAVMTGVKPKSTFLLPWVAWPMMTASLGVLWRRFWGVERHYFQAERDRIETSFDTQCLTDINVPCGTALETKDGEDLQAMFSWSNPSSSRGRALVGFGTEYGFSKDIAKQVCDALHATNQFEPRLVDLEHFECIDFVQERLVIIVCSTAGDGAFPVRAQAFFDAIPALPALDHVSAFVLACGDSAYPKYCFAGRALASGLEKRGARTVCQDLDGDNTVASEQWVQSIVSQALASFPPLLQTLEDDYLYPQAEAVLAKMVGSGKPKASKSDPYFARVKSKTKLTTHPPCGWAEDKWHIVLDVSGAAEGFLDYLPGDALGVLAENDPKEVALLQAKLGNRLVGSLANKNLRDATSKLLELAATGTSDKKSWIADWLPALTTTVDADTCFKAIQPRFYSICSSPSADKGEIHLCVAALRYELHGRKTGGVASTFLTDRVQVGDTVRVFVQSNPSFRVNLSAGKKLMIGPGTGVAPFRAFAREEPNAAPGHNLLYFGCRYEQGDYLYGKEWPTTKYDVCAAFSRDQAQRVYVQHQLVASGQSVWENFLTHADTQVYICGDGFSMARDVEAALVEILRTHGGFESEAAALQFLKPRLHLDVWVV